MEGTIASVPPQNTRKHPQQEFIQVDTSNILFICGGAFTGINKIIENRTAQNSIGFGAQIKQSAKIDNTKDLMQQLEIDDLIKFGLIPEFVGRLPVIAKLDNLDHKALVSILSEPKNALIKQYQKIFEFDKVELDFTESGLSLIAQKALEKKIGARGLRSIIENLLLDTMFNIRNQNQGCKFTVDTLIEQNQESLAVIKSTKEPKKRKNAIA